MLKRILLLFLLSIPLFSSVTAQRSDSYKNLEKYWYYRYRLVNDFLKIGLNAGESIPAAYRKNGGDTGAMGWGVDATNSVGNYIMTLATEFKQLSKNGLSTQRTEYELEYAIKAFIRLDEHAELFQNAATSKTYPDMYPGHFNGWHPGTNGYFIRDDVPFLTFVNDNYYHFNRLGLRANSTAYIADRVFSRYDNFDHYKTAYEGRYDGIDPRTSMPMSPLLDAVYNNSNPPPISPVQESQDQLTSVWPALAFAYKHIYKGTGNPLESLLKDELYKTIDYIRDNDWLIKDPITSTCVYGIASDDWGKTWGCSKAGADFRANAIPSSDALRIVTGDNIVAPSYTMGLFKLSQALGKYHKDISYTDAFVAFSNSWWPTSFINIIDHSLHGAFRSPYMPLLYRYNHGRVAVNKGVGFFPESWGTIAEIGTCGYTYTLPSYEQLLNVAPPCGPYHYASKSQKFWHVEWSGENRVQDPFKRDASCYGEPPEGSEDNDYNGLDYMYLFNLYSLVTGDKYLKTMSNPYYEDNFTKPFPSSDPKYGWIGNNDNKLKLNYLEYLGLKNTISMSGNVTFRGAQAVELLPGFHAMLGSNTLVYVEDYKCAGGHNQDEPFVHAYLSKPIEQMIEGGEVVEEFIPVEYGDENMDDTSTFFNENDTVGNGYFPIYDTTYINSLIDSVLITGDSDLIRIMYNMLDTTDSNSINYKTSTNSDPGSISTKEMIHRYQKRVIQKSGFAFLRITIHPNPTTGQLNITMPAQGDYDVKITNMLGVVVYQGKLKDEQQKQIQLESSLPSGNYTVQITGKEVNHIEKIILTR